MSIRRELLPVLPPLFDDLDHGKLGDEDAEYDATSDLLDMMDMEEEENDSVFPPQQYRPSNAADVAPPAESEALSVHSFYLQLAPGQAKACLRPNPAFVAKVMESTYRCPTLELLAFHPPPFLSEEDM